MAIGSTKRIILAGLICAAAGSVLAPQASAGPLCDWLFGRTAPAYPAPGYQPYGAGYPVHAVPVTTGYPVTAGYAPAPINYSAGYAPVAPAPVVAAPATGAAALQMPSYNAYYAPSYPAPAVSAGDQGYVAYSPPSSSSYPPSGVPLTSYYGTGNAYPDYGAYAAPAYGYSAGYGTVPAPQPVAPVAAYQPAVPPAGSTVQTYPGIPAARPGLLGGVSSFFGSLFGTGYNTSYYRAPVTYYRPVTSYDAAGQAVVTQQPCTSYEYQLQRAPYTTFSPLASGATTPGYGGCSTVPTAGYNPYAGGYAGGTYLTPGASGVVPASGTYYGPPVSGVSPAIGSGIPAGQNPYGNLDAAPLEAPSLDPGAVDPNSVQRPAMPSNAISPLPPTVRYLPQAQRTEPRATENSDAAKYLSGGSVGNSSGVRPLPAGDYPYPRQKQLEAPGLIPEEQTLPSSPSTTPSPFTEVPRKDDPSGDRVAQATWGYKPIQWSVQRASYQAPAVEPSRASQLVVTEPAVNVPTDNEPTVNKSGITVPQLSAPANASLRAPANVASPSRPTASSAAGPSSSRALPPAVTPQRSYESLGWRRSK